MGTTARPAPGGRGRSGARRTPSTGATRSTTGFSPCSFRPISSGSCRTIGWCAIWAGKTAAQVLQRLRQAGRVTPADDPRPPRPGSFGVYLDGAWYRLELDPRRASTAPIRSDRWTCRCCRTGCWGRSSGSATRAPTSGSTSWAGSAGRRSWSGGWIRVRWRSRSRSIRPPSTSSWRCPTPAPVMPPKSTWFEPKLRSGLFVHTF